MSNPQISEERPTHRPFLNLTVDKLNSAMMSRLLPMVDPLGITHHLRSLAAYTVAQVA